MTGRIRLFALAAFCVFICAPSQSLGGGGPEQVLLVVNPRSPDSLSIANHYLQLRHVPAENVLYLPWDPAKQRTDVDTFRREILAPVLKVVSGRRDVARIDCVVYSSGFPWAINTSPDVDKLLLAQKADAKESQAAKDANGAKDESESDDNDSSPADERNQRFVIEWPRHLTKVGSINGLTYLWERVVSRNPINYMALGTNWYMRHEAAEEEQVATSAFCSSNRFGPQGETLDPAALVERFQELRKTRQHREAGKEARIDLSPLGSSYLLSVMLAVTAGRGNTVEEVLHYLRRSAAADGTRPTGTIYYVKNANVRSQARHDAFPAAVSQLKELGVAAQIVEGTVPRQKTDVQGAMLGTASFDWEKCQSTIRPGAICEHLTSAGGVMSAGAGQTPLSEFLRYGAAGASGTVTEPYAIQAKFPVPQIHVHYARGCTLAEAFYQSVNAPYQLLIVGDPLCRPWANIPAVRVKGARAGATVEGLLELEPAATIPGQSAISHFELFVDGSIRARCKPGESLKLDTARLPDGYHELRVIAFEAGPIQSQGRRIIPITTSNHGRTARLSVSPQGTIPAGKPLVATVKSPGSIGIAVMQNTRLLGRVAREAGKIEIDAAKLGSGPVRLHAVGLGKGLPNTNAVSAPVEVVLP